MIISGTFSDKFGATLKSSHQEIWKPNQGFWKYESIVVIYISNAIIEEIDLTNC